LLSSALPKVCAVSYLNTVPLVWGLLHGDQRDIYDVSFAIPSECADRLADGRADIGIVPVVEAARLGLTIIPGAGIASNGPVRSILLISKVPFGDIRTLAADTSSRTSVQLARVILAHRYDTEPVLLPHAPQLVPMLAKADAALIIGDPALAIEPATLGWRWLDLGDEWKRMTGLPMVFAVWAARPSLPETSYDAADFIDSVRFGMASLDRIVDQEHRRRGMPADLVRDYLTRNVVFDFGDNERMGLRRFLTLVSELPSAAPAVKISV
jgi:predicted solute-binding protein